MCCSSMNHSAFDSVSDIWIFPIDIYDISLDYPYLLYGCLYLVSPFNYVYLICYNHLINLIYRMVYFLYIFLILGLEPLIRGNHTKFEVHPLEIPQRTPRQHLVFGDIGLFSPQI